MDPRKSFLALPFSFLLIFFLIIISLCEGKRSSDEHHVKAHKGPLVEKGQIKTIVDTEYGEISAIMVKEGHKTPPYHLQFFTLEPNSVFLPVLLHADMVFYVYTGSGRLTWADEDGGTDTIDLREGDVCSLGEGFVFYIHSNLEAQRNKLRIYAMFSNTEDSTFDSSIGAYSRINNLVKGFDKKIMQAAFKVPEDLAEAITNKTETPAIVHAAPEKNKHNSAWELEALFLKYFTGILSNSEKLKKYNIFTNDPDFKNVHGWTTTVTKKQLKQLKRHNIGFLMVNLTMGSMLGPHWNPRATEVAIVLQGEGMVRVVCGSNNDDDDDECQNKRFRVKQGDVFVVPRFHPMAHMSFEKEPLAFMGFSTAAKQNNPQFLVGKGSVLELLDRHILATSLGVSNRTIDKLLASPDESIIFGCDSCAEEEERIMEEEEEKEKEEEEKRKKEEREEEEAEKRKEEEEERERRRKEEEEEEVRRREEMRKREEKAARRQQEERERRREEKEARRRAEERREEEEEARRQIEEEEARREEERREEEEEARRQREEEETRREREREEEAAAREEKQRREEEEARREKERETQEEEAEREQEKARRQQEEREKKREEEARREREREEKQREEEEARREREEEEARREREREEEAARRQRKERKWRREEEERERRSEEEEAEREQERGREEEPAEGEEEAARRQQEERERRREEEGEREREEEQSERERGGGGGRRRREEEEAERGREGETPAEGEEEAARKQQEERERRRGEEGEREREEEHSERERGVRRRRGREEERGDEPEASWEEEEARRQQEERERRREQGRDNKSMKSIEGRRSLKMRNVNVGLSLN